MHTTSRSACRQRLASLPLILCVLAGAAQADDNAAPGAGNALAIEISSKSALVSSAKAFIDQHIGEIRDDKLRTATADAIDNPGTCIRHRAGLDSITKARIIETLKAEGVVDPEDDKRFPGGLTAGVFPAVKGDGTDCPQLTQTFTSAPGSVFGGHHSYPGGLPVHEAFNLSSAISLADNYRRAYGHAGPSGLPEVTPANAPTGASDIAIDQDIILAAPLWHDWAKTIVFQWTAAGSEFPELNFGGNGKTDKYGETGNSKTGGHHIIGVAEAMARGLPPAFVITQASAHMAPAGAQEFMVVNWLRSAAIIARKDPFAAGYLIKDERGRMRLPPLRHLASVPIQQSLPDEPNLLVEYVLHHLSDADYPFTGAAVAEVQVLLGKIAGGFGYDEKDAANYNTKFRNPVLSRFSAERLQIIYSAQGIDGVVAEVEKLRQAGMI
jgi:hypothetical protein